MLDALAGDVCGLVTAGGGGGSVLAEEALEGGWNSGPATVGGGAGSGGAESLALSPITGGVPSR